MARGFAAAKKVGDFGGGSTFQPRPPGINYFGIKDGQVAVVRFLTAAEDIEWARKWKLPPTRNYQYGEMVNAVDQLEDGTSDPGYAANLKSGFRAYPLLIWRSAPVYLKGPDGKLVKDSNGGKQITGYADQLCVWECSFEVYQNLQAKDEKYRGLASRDLEIRRRGASTDTEYLIEPADLDSGPQPFTAGDQSLMSTSMIDVSIFVKVPTFEELQSYINGGGAPAPTPTPAQQATANAAAPDGANPFLS